MPAGPQSTRSRRLLRWLAAEVGGRWLIEHTFENQHDPRRESGLGEAKLPWAPKDVYRKLGQRTHSLDYISRDALRPIGFSSIPRPGSLRGVRGAAPAVGVA